MQQTGTAGSYDLSSDYRYGYNGKEKDNEIKGEANSLDYGARIYDPRVGRWMSTDPKERDMPDHSPYQTNFNNPIFYMDPDGEKPWPTNIVDKIDDRNGYSNVLLRGISVLIPIKEISFGKDCITLFNDIVQNALFTPNQKTGNKIVGENSTHEALLKNGRATNTLSFGFNTKDGKKAFDNSTAFSLSSSIGDYIKAKYNVDEGGVKIYGVSVLDGNHSMIITYGKNEEGEMEFNLFDQGPGTTGFSGRNTFSTAAELDAQLNSYVRGWKDKRNDNGTTIPAEISIFLIKPDEEKQDDKKGTQSTNSTKK